jgi:hypothetical protein
MDFVMKLTPDNKALTDKMRTCKTPEDAFIIAEAEGLTDSLEVFVSEMKRFQEAINDLSEDDLANVAGGATLSEVATVVSASVGATATGAIFVSTTVFAAAAACL